jgi:hydrogenase-1 operon protein HyaE
MTHPLVGQLFTRHGFVELAADTVDAFAQAPGLAMIVFLEDPAKVRESLDLAVIAPQIGRAFAPGLRAGALVAEPARAVAPRYGFRRWPALVLLRDGAYLGAIDGLRVWDEYVTQVAALLGAPPARPPGAHIPIQAV